MRLVGFNFLCLIFLLLFLQSCRSIQPELPSVTHVQAPQEQKERNEFVIPLQVNLTSYLNQARLQVPGNYSGNYQTCEGTSYDLYFEQTGVKMNTFGNTLETQIDGKYRIKLNYCPKCSDLFTSSPICVTPRIPFSCGVGEAMPKLRITLRTAINVGSDYHLNTQTGISALNSVTPCEVTVFYYDISETLMEEMNKALKREMMQLDKNLGKISFENSFRDLWTGIQQPLAIPGIGYLHFAPTSLKMTTPVLKQNMLYTTLVIGNTSYVNGQKQTEVNRTLPSLENIPVPPHDTFELHTDLNLNYDSIGQLIQREIAGKRIDLKKKHIQIDSLRIRCLDNQRLLIGMHFSGSRKGIIYLTGKPVIDGKEQTFHFQELNYYLKTKNVLLKSAGWLFNERILNELNRASTIPLTPLLNQLKTQITRQLNFTVGEFTITGKSYAIEIERIIPSTEGLYLRSLFKGQINVNN